MCVYLELCNLPSALLAEGPNEQVFYATVVTWSAMDTEI